ncbi:MAG: hypothetical protein EON87_11525 [Brevundimonas sp.]|nr:MAG: hypothetical protein EON87_11525 [Brevundimonas sp.]
MSVKTFVAQRLLPLLARLDLLEAGSSAANAALFLATSTTSNAIGTGTKTFTTQSGKAFVAGQFVQVSDQANPANYMLGQVSSYSGTSLVVEVSSVGGSGTKTAWNIALSGPGGATGGISGGTLTGDLGDAPEVTVASAATTNIGAANSNKVVVSGNVTITAFDSVANRRKLLRFTGTPLLTHGANLILPGAADMQMAAGDLAEFTSDGSGVWRMRKYQSVSESNYGRSLLNTISQAAARLLLGMNSRIVAPQGRLTLTTAVPITTADVLAATTIRYTPHLGALIPIQDGTNWESYFFSELSLALDATNTDTGYHQAGKNFDLFVINDAGTLRLVSGPAWTTDTARAAALSMANGIRVNTASMTVRFGSATGNTLTIGAGLATYVGTFRASADGQVEDSRVKRFLFNGYNRVRRALLKQEAADSWTYTTQAWRQMNGNTANQVEFVLGLSHEAVTATATASGLNTTPGSIAAGIGLDRANAPDTTISTGSFASTTKRGFTSHYIGNPAAGYHYLAPVEWSQATGTTTWYGDNGNTQYDQAGIIGEVWA